MRAESCDHIPLREGIVTTARHLARHAEQLHCPAALEHISTICHQGSDAHFLHGEYARRGVVEAMVGSALQRFWA